jgi:hypothetical protein
MFRLNAAVVCTLLLAGLTVSGARADDSDPCGGAGRLLASVNRPSVGFSTCVVPGGWVLLEEGYQNQSQGGGSPAVVTQYPQGYERIGLSHGWEADLVGPNFNVQRTSVKTSGYGDYGLGVTYELPQSGSFTYSTNLLFTPADGSGGFSAGGPTETFNLNVSYSLSPAMGVSATLASAQSAGTAPDGTFARFFAMTPSIGVSAQIPNFYQFYVQFVGQTKLGPGQGGRIFTDFGVQKQLSPNVVVDTEYGIGFTPVAGGSPFRYFGFGTGLHI